MDDGVYAAVYGQCSKHYWQCEADKTTLKTCDNGLFFNNAIEGCDIPGNIADCRTISDEGNEALESNEVVEPDCAFLEDGPLEHSTCSPLHFSCIRGQLLKLQCPSGQVYDATQKRCDDPEFVPGCSPTRPKISQETRIIPAPEISNYCKAHGDGIYSAGCENYFYLCGQGGSYRVNCPSGLFFESNTRTCSYKERVPECNNNSAVETARSSATQQANGSDIDTKEVVEPSAVSQDERINEVEIAERSRASHIPEAALPAAIGVPLPKAKDQPILPDGNYCKAHGDGIYSAGCENYFYLCGQGGSYRVNCPSGLFFESNTRTCSYKERVPECNNNSAVETAR
ncbi:unnamed protein product [Gongylonema pulchrum]|uniref:Chitin-binding type-2 domain-containing protein n=1 Tax=Gongylonema pulchrum TaxID=637853 RepID=A0A183DS31_9BILA|nr:unnamed protein product [Gongylonema pulchrum]